MSLGGALVMLTLAWWAPSAVGDTVNDGSATTVATSQPAPARDATNTVDAQAAKDPAAADQAAPTPAPAPNPCDAGTTGDPVTAPTAERAPAPKKQNPTCDAAPKNGIPAGTGAMPATSSDRPATGTQAPTPAPSSTDLASAPAQAPSPPVAPPPPPVSGPVTVAYLLNRPAAPRTAPPPAPAEPVVEASHREARRPVRVLVAIRPTSPSVLSSPRPVLAPPTISATPQQPNTPAAAGRARVHRSKPAQASRPTRNRAPAPPSGPPDRDPVASSAGPSGGGASAAMWCAILVGFLLCAAGELRRALAPRLLAAPAGIPSQRQRPG